MFLQRLTVFSAEWRKVKSSACRSHLGYYLCEPAVREHNTQASISVFNRQRRANCCDLFAPVNTQLRLLKWSKLQFLTGSMIVATIGGHVPVRTTFASPSVADEAFHQPFPSERPKKYNIYIICHVHAWQGLIMDSTPVETGRCRFVD